MGMSPMFLGLHDPMYIFSFRKVALVTNRFYALESTSIPSELASSNIN
jgi:hypothetical protein